MTVREKEEDHSYTCSLIDILIHYLGCGFPGGLFNRREIPSSPSTICVFTRVVLDALQSFILISSQSKTGGLRDKPGRPADAYHTLYNLSGLSSAQHHMVRTSQAREKLLDKWVDADENEKTEEEKEAVRKRIFIESVCWAEDESAERYVGGKENRVVRYSFSGARDGIALLKS